MFIAVNDKNIVIPKYIIAVALLNHLGMLFTSKMHIYKIYQNNYRIYGILLQVYYYF